MKAFPISEQKFICTYKCGKEFIVHFLKWLVSQKWIFFCSVSPAVQGNVYLKFYNLPPFCIFSIDFVDS